MIEAIGSNNSSIQSILSNIRSIKEGFDHIDQKNSFGSDIGLNAGKSIGHTQFDSFQDAFQNAVKSVSNAQMESHDLKTKFELGDPNVSLEQVTIASQQASIGFEAMLQVRNKLVDAYKDIMNMPV